MIRIDRERTPRDLLPSIEQLFALSAAKITAIERSWDPAAGAPVFTVKGRYQARGWTEWTQGFQFGSALLQFDATASAEFLDLGRRRTVERMAPHLTHIGVHDHGFNNVSTYGTLWRLAREGRVDADEWELRFYELALKVSGAVQARRWTPLPDGGFIHSFNGAHSLFVDTIRSLRALALGARARPAADGGAGRAGQPARSAASSTRARRRSTTSTTARAATLRRARARRAREPVQRRQRHLPRPEHAAGLLAVHAPGRAAWRGRCSGSPSSSSSSTTIAGRGARRVRRPRRGRAMHARAPRARPATHYIDVARRPTACRTGTTGAPGLAALGELAATAPPIRSTITSRSTVPRPRSRRRDCCGSAILLAPRGDGREPLSAGRPARRSTRCSTSGTVPEHRPRPQGLLLHSVYHWPNGWDYVPPGALDPARRVEPVGRLPRPRGRALRPAARRPAARTWRSSVLTAAAGRERRADDTANRARHGRHTGHRPRHRARARARRLEPGSRAACDRPTEVAGVLDELRAPAAASRLPARRHRRSRAIARRLAERSRSRYGAVNALVNNAGRAPRVRADLLDATEESFEELVRTNLQGPYFLTQAIAREHGGAAAGRPGVRRLPWSSSRRSRPSMASLNRGEYCVSKAGLSMTARLFALRLAPDGIPVYEVRPGIIATDMTAAVSEIYDRRIADGLVPEQRWGRPEDVGRAVAALLRGDVPYATGTHPARRRRTLDPAPVTAIGRAAAASSRWSQSAAQSARRRTR